MPNTVGGGLGIGMPGHWFGALGVMVVLVLFWALAAAVALGRGFGFGLGGGGVCLLFDDKEVNELKITQATM